MTRKGCLFGENKENRQVETTAASKRLKTPVRLDEDVERRLGGWNQVGRRQCVWEASSLDDFRPVVTREEV